jgi:hypothetical protein
VAAGTDPVVLHVLPKTCEPDKHYLPVFVSDNQVYQADTYITINLDKH